MTGVCGAAGAGSRGMCPRGLGAAVYSAEPRSLLGSRTPTADRRPPLPQPALGPEACAVAPTPNAASADQGPLISRRGREDGPASSLHMNTCHWARRVEYALRPSPALCDAYGAPTFPIPRPPSPP